MHSVLDALDAHAAERPDALALDDISYAVLRDASLRVAAKLRAKGLRPGDRLAIYAENRPGFVYAYLGGLRAGAIVVTVNVLYRTSDLEHILDDATPTVVCVSEQSAKYVTPPVRRDRAPRPAERAARLSAGARPRRRRDPDLYERDDRAFERRDAHA